MSAEITFADLFDIEHIQRIQDSFALSTNVASIITNPDGFPITRPSNFCRLCMDIIRETEAGRANCFRSDAIIGRPRAEGPIIQPCLSGGLWDAGASIMAGDTHIANWLIGQVRNDKQDKSEMLKYARSISADEGAFMEALEEVTVMSLEQFTHVANTLFMIANQLSELALKNLQQAEAIEKLQESEEKMSLILSSTAEGIYGIDMQGKCTMANDSCVSLLGYQSEAEFLGKNMHALIHYRSLQGEIPPQECRIYKSFKEGQRIHDDTEVFWRRDGTCFPVEYWAYPIRKNGSVIGGVVAFTDITERKEAELNLQRSNKETKAMLQAARGILQNKPFPVTAKSIFDTCKELVGATAGYVALLSESGEENEVLFLDAGGRACTVDSSLPMPIRGLRAEAYRFSRTVYDNAFKDSHWMAFMPAGHVPLDNVLFAPLPIEGKVAGIMGLANKPGGFDSEDIRVATAFGELAAVALKNSRDYDALVEAIALKDNLIREINHRIKNNFTILQSLLELQTARSEGLETKASLKEVKGRVQSMTMIHARLNQDETLRYIDFSDYVRGLTRYLKESFADKDKAITLRTEGIPAVKFDVQVMIPCGLMLNELVTNSLKYAFRERDNGEIAVSLEAKGDNTWLLTVRDNGCGLPDGFDMERTGSVGMRILQALAGQLEGDFRISSDGGTLAQVTFRTE